MANIKNRAIIFIHKDKFQYYDEIQSKIFQFIFQPTVFQDLELVDADELDLQLKTFVTTNKLSPANILFVISDAIIFEKIIALTPTTNKDLEIQKFLESIPFEHVSYKIIGDEKNYKVLAINKELYTSLQFSFESFGFKSLGIIAHSSLGEIYRNSQNLSPDIVKYILSQFETLQKLTFAQEEVKQTPQSTVNENLNPVAITEQKTIPPVSKFRLPALISVFFVLIGILTFVVYKQYTPASKASPVPTTITAPTLSAPTPTIQETPVSSPSAKPT